jgi:hypothetical protein
MGPLNLIQSKKAAHIISVVLFFQNRNSNPGLSLCLFTGLLAVAHIISFFSNPALSKPTFMKLNLMKFHEIFDKIELNFIKQVDKT